MSDSEYKDLHEKVQRVEIQLTRLNSHIESEIGNTSRLVNDMNNVIKRYDKILLGNGERGLIEKVHSLIDKESSREKHIFALWVSFCGLVAKFVHDVIK